MGACLVTQEFPEGLTVAKGRYRLTTLLRGEQSEGLWVATDREHGSDVWVTFRNIPATQPLLDKLTFSAKGVAAPLYVGAPDPYRPGDDHVPRAFLVIVDEIPNGQALAEAGRLEVREAIRLGLDLCEVITEWAAARGGYVLNGLRPETVFVIGEAGARRFSAATPRPYYILSDESPYGSYPYPPYRPPSGDWDPSPHDALFVVALLIWYAVTGIHPYVIPNSDMRVNQWHDTRLPFEGPAALGELLERALIADLALRISVVDFRAGLEKLLPSHDNRLG